MPWAWAICPVRMPLAWVNWVEQSINTASQLCLMPGVIFLHKAGLKNWSR